MVEVLRPIFTFPMSSLFLFDICNGTFKVIEVFRAFAVKYFSFCSRYDVPIDTVEKGNI